MQIDAATFFAAIDEARDPSPILSREEAVLIAMANGERIPGHCAACRIPISNGPAGRWCDECADAAERLRDALRWRKGQYVPSPFIKCSNCRVRFPRPPGGRVTRCPPCQKAHRRAENAARMRRGYVAKRGEAA